jgi:hypothetical protein
MIRLHNQWWFLEFFLERGFFDIIFQFIKTQTFLTH